MDLQKEAYRLFETDIQQWQLAHDKYEEMKLSQEEVFDFGDFKIEVVCNPARIRSTAARVHSVLSSMRRTDKPFVAQPSNNEHTCFLCSDVRPKEQSSIPAGDFELLVNPYPIFPKHFTIAHKVHQKQEIMPYFEDFLYFARQMTDFALFFNGANCGASAPFHIHFQAAEKHNFPVIGDFETMPASHFVEIYSSENCKITEVKEYLRHVFCIEGSSEEEIKRLFYNHFQQNIEQNMLNLVACYENEKYKLFVFPRKKFRPSQFYEEDTEKQLLISPASVEMSGRIVTIFKEHFDRISREDIIDIYQQIS